MADDNIKPVSKKLLAGAGSSVIAFTSIVFAYIDAKTDAVNDQFKSESAYIKQYVDSRNTDIEKKLDKIENVLTRVDERIYEIIKSHNNKQGE